MASEPDPQWGREAWRGFIHEWRAYGRVVVTVTREPRRFMREWADGEREALNPIACVLNVIAIVTVVNVLAHQLRHINDDRPPWLDLLGPALQLLNSALIASLVHFPLRLFGARRPWRTTMATVLYVTAGPLLPLYVARDALFPLHDLKTAPPPAFIAIGFTIVAVLLGYLVATLANVHRVAWWRVLLAFVLGIVIVVGAAVLMQRAHLTFSF